MEQFFIAEPGFKSMVWSQGWCCGRRCEASSLKTLEYFLNCAGMWSMEALGAVLAAISVLVVVFARMAKWSYLRKL